MAKNPEQLECLSIIICDDIYRDEQTKKLVLAGTFNAIHAARFPYSHPRLRVLLTLTNGRGEYDVALSIENGQTGYEIAKLEGPMEFDNPLAIIDINVEMRNLVFPEEGKYWVTLKESGEIICQRPFFVLQIHEDGVENEGT